MSQIVWRPPCTPAEPSATGRFAAGFGHGLGLELSDFASLHRASVEHPRRFWSDLWRFAGVVGDMGPPPYLLEEEDLLAARFFPAARLNYAENALTRQGAEPALVFRGEHGVRRTVSRDELRIAVARAQAAFSDCGVREGDRVAAILPNLPEAVVAMLATASVGAVWSSCSPDFGVTGVLDRFGQIAPTVLVVCDGYHYAGKVISIADKVLAIVRALPSLRAVIVVDCLGDAAEVARDLAAADRGCCRVSAWADEVDRRPACEPAFIRLPFDHPLCILFSSGTTGVPKCIVHRAGGVLLKHLSEHLLHTDVGEGDRVFYFTTLGWMMWNWLVSGLLAGATLLLYDGSPFHPDGHVLWRFAEDERCTHFGTSAKYIDALAKSGAEPAASHDLGYLRAVMSTGSPLSPDGFDFVYRAVKADVHLASISGGTDICGCPALGLAVDVADDTGAHLAQGKGELVCRNPFPSMPLGFWNDPDGTRYRAAYFVRFPGIWHHGDFAEWTENGGMIIHGRSDATLNPGGVRIGTSEIYRIVEQMPEIRESIVIGQDVAGDVRIVLFVVLRPGAVLDDALATRMRVRIRDGASPRHVPARIVAVGDIPRTKSGKITELAVRDVVMGREVKNREALANPEALDLFRDLPELRS